MTDFLPVILNRPLDRQRYSREFKRQIVEESLTLGASIAAVAQAHYINANLLHKWRWSYRNKEYGAVAKHSQPAAIRANTNPSSHIDLFFNDTRVIVHGAPDTQTLRSVIDALRL